jgi:hypothetical protein
MSSAPEEMLVQRQLRAAEIALSTARKRRFETDEEAVELRAQVAELNLALEAVAAARESDAQESRVRIAELQAELAVGRRHLLDERAGRLAAEQDLTELRREAMTREDTIAQLASERRIAELEGELEFVLRRATEFEYGVRMALADALTFLRDLGSRVKKVSDAQAAGSEPLKPERLDAALERLRAAVPEQPEDE